MRAPWWLFFTFCWLSHCAVCSLSDSLICLNGASANGSCICDESHSLPCWTCVGRVVLTGPSGQIQYSLSNYSSDGSCIWLVEPVPPTAVLRVTVNDFSTICGAEYLYAYDGTSAHAVQTMALTGDSFSSNGNYGPPAEPLRLTFYSGTALLYFVSNTSLAPAVASYFDISYSVDNCTLDCSGNGHCSADGTSCVCNVGWAGADCSVLECPSNCSGHGECVNGTCNCSNTFQGPDCATQVDSDLWLRVVASGSYPVGGRASAAVVTLDGQIWLHGGYGLCRAGGAASLPLPPYGGCSGGGYNGTDGTMYRFDPSSSLWMMVPPRGNPATAPSARYGHTMVLLGSNEFLMYGGTSGQQAVRDLWSYDVVLSEWRRIIINGSVSLTGHTAHMLNSSCMLVLFGYSSTHGYSSNVYSVTLAGDGTAQMVMQPYSSDSAVVSGSYGHTSVYDPQTMLIYVYGGYKPGGGSSTSPLGGQRASNELLAYDVAASRWSFLRSGPSSALLHSAVLLDRSMVVYGGSCGRSFAQDDGRCFMSALMVYNLDCKTWTSADRPSLAESGRFGHAAASLNGSMYVVGGFNGRTLSDVLVYSPACTSAVNNGSSCTLGASVSSAVATSANRCTDTFPTDADRTALCSSFGSCFQCLGSQLSCSWSSNGTCTALCPQGARCKNTTDRAVCECSGGGSTRDCRTCLQVVGCRYSAQLGCLNPLKLSRLPMVAACWPSCSQSMTCDACTATPGCSWCSSYGGSGTAAGGVCYEQTAYTPTFPYGQCLQIAMSAQQCQAATCRGHQTCAQCLGDPRCGWYDDGTGTGVGVCSDGDRSGPLSQMQLTIGASGSASPDYDSRRWYIMECPLCQCNGHSQCSADGVTCSSCDSPTTGPQCKQCRPGYYGNPVNGGNCSVCSCEGRSDNNQCNAVTGACVCNVRGTTGSRCDMCDNTQRYVGNPDAGVNCYYPLTSEYRYTFNFSRPDDKHFTIANLHCLPPMNDSDVDVEISCSPALGYLNFTLESDLYPQPLLLMSHTACTSQTKLTYSATTYAIGQRYNSTFVLTLYDYQMPLILVVSFSQTSQDLDLFRFFVIFFSCFVALLLLVGIGWRLKLRHNFRRHQQRLRQQQQTMAKRAFAELYVVLEPKEDALVPSGGRRRQQQQHSSGGVDVAPGGPCSRGLGPTAAAAVTAAAVEASGSPLAVVSAAQPLASKSSFVVSVLLRLPTGNRPYCQPGQYGLAIGSTMVALHHASTTAGAQQPKHAERPPWSRAKRASQATDFTCL